MLTSAPDVLEHISFADGEAYNNRLIPISRGEALPDRKHSAMPHGCLKFAYIANTV